MTRLVLASSSPSRLSILRSAGVEPLVLPSAVDEDAAAAQLSDPTPEQFVTHLATAKARDVMAQLRTPRTDQARSVAEKVNATDSAVIVGGDSMLLLDGQLQGKPHTVEETIRRWQQQRGRIAHLVTGHCVIHQGQERCEATTTAVHFSDATDEDIAAYARTGEPLQCAGAFTLEAIGGWFIDRIEGDPSSVIGLSLPAVRHALTHLGIPTHSLWNRAAQSE